MILLLTCFQKKTLYDKISDINQPIYPSAQALVRHSAGQCPSSPFSITARTFKITFIHYFHIHAFACNQISLCGFVE